MCRLLMLLVFIFAFLATPRQGSAVRDPRRQLGPEGFDTPDGPRPIVRRESNASTAVGSCYRRLYELNERPGDLTNERWTTVKSAPIK